MNKKIAKLVNKISIKRKLYMISILGGILPIMLVLVFFIFQMKNDFEYKENIILDKEIENLDFEIDTIFNEAQELIVSYSGDAQLKDLFNTLEPSYLYDFSTEMYEKKVLTDTFKDVHLYLEAPLINYTDDFISYDDKLSSLIWYKELERAPLRLHVYEKIDDGVVEMSLIKSVTTNDLENVAIFKLDLHIEVIEQQLRRVFPDSNHNTIYVVNELDEIIMSNKSIYSSNDVQFLKLDESKYESGIVKSVTLGNDYFLRGWRLYYVSEEGIFQGEFIENVSMIFLLTLVIILIIGVLNYLLASSISGRLKIMNQSMHENTIDQLIEIKVDMGTDEIGQTTTVFNQMIRRIKYLIAEIKDEKVKSDSLVIEKTDAYEEVHQSLLRIQTQNAHISALINLDHLTGLKNRFAITKIIQESIKENPDESFAVMFLDIDNFKFINDTYGHDLGDEVIKATAKFIDKYSNEYVQVGRFGGDEFIICFNNTKNNSETMTLFDQILKEFEKPILIENKKFYLTNSVGVAYYPEHGVESNELIKRADLALHHSKETGKNKITIFDVSFDLNLEEKLIFQNAIKEAIENDEFYLNFQPCYYAKDLSIYGFEALIRWKSLIFGQVSPYKLISNVEAMGLIIDLGEWIIEEACKFSKRIDNMSNEPIHVAINISIIQLMSPDFVNKVKEIFDRTGVNPKHIVFEMTETILMDAIDRSVDILEKLRYIGIGIAIDDFGTGYSSLSYLKTLPVSILKIDQSFIDSIAKDTFDEDFIKLITVIAHNKDILVVAEGVETAVQLEKLKEFKVDILQGYYLNRPMSDIDAYELVNKKVCS